MAPASALLSSKTVCVMDASGSLGAALVEKLLNMGYIIHAATSNRGEYNRLKGLGNKMLKVFRSDPFDYHSIVKALKGCSGLFYCFQQEQDQQSNYDEFMAEVEMRAALNVIEACAQTDTMERVVFTSSVTAVIWKENRKSAAELDEKDWSDPNFCRKFKVTVEAISSTRDVVATSSQPCMLKFHSLPVQLTRTFLMGIPLLVGMRDESLKLVIETLRYKGSNHKTEVIFVRLKPGAGTVDLPQIYEAEMTIKTQLPRSKELVYNWKWAFYVWIPLSVYAMLLITLICCFKPFGLSRGRSNDTELANEVAKDQRYNFRSGGELSDDFSDVRTRLPEHSRSNLSLFSNELEKNWTQCHTRTKRPRSYSNQLWYALAKTLSEKTAWSLAMDRGVHMVSINTGVLTGPELSGTSPCLKGAPEMYKDGGR